MSDSPLPPRVQAFLSEHIFSASQLDVLLLVRAADGQPRTAVDVGRELRLPVGSIAPWLDAYVSRGLLVRTAAQYRYAPAEPASEDDLAQVAEAYARRRVSVTRRIHSSGQDPLMRFADAFRLRRDKES